MIERLHRFRRLLARQRQQAGRLHDPTIDWRLTIRRRVVVAMGALLVWAIGIEARLVYLQVFQRADLETRARDQQESVSDAPATRGDILDRRGHVLATSADTPSIWASPSEIPAAAAAVEQLCRALANCTREERSLLLKRFGNRKKLFAWVRRRVSSEEASRVAALNLNYVSFRQEPRRFYPNKQLAAHLLGWVGTDNNGLEGIEYAYNRQIRGRDGQVVVQTDALRHVFSRVEQAPTPGSTLELTIDEALQHVAERELRAGVIENRAASGTAIVLDPRTGEILAMANEPTFDPNVPRDSHENDRRNRAVQDLYEPGSTFKIVTASAAIEEHVMPVSTLIDTSPGVIRVSKNHVVDEYHGHNYGVLSFGDVIVKSSNVGAIKIGFKVGRERMSEYVRRFGFGRPASPDFPGENAGIVWSAEKLTDSALASVSMGYQVAVTPLQMLAAVSAVANGGELVEPRVVGAIYRNGLRVAVRPKVLRRTISAETAAALTAIMERVVAEGTGKAAQIPGFTVAGKTGTASKLVGGRYSASDNYASFVGFVPSQKPAVAIIVMVDSPHGNGSSGGVVAAPIFQRIAVSALRRLGVAPTVNPNPPVLLAHASEGSRVPAVGASRAPTVKLVADDDPGTLPDLRGLSAREANRRLVRLGLTAKMFGHGFVVSQTPAPGTPVEVGSACELALARSPVESSAGGAQP